MSAWLPKFSCGKIIADDASGWSVEFEWLGLSLEMSVMTRDRIAD